MGKGQASGPFELLIAVIVLIFALTIALTVIEDIKERDCSARTKKALSDFKIALERAVTENAPSDFKFDLPDDCAPMTHTKLKALADTTVCSAACGGAKRDCVILEYNEFEFVSGAGAGGNCPGEACVATGGAKVCVEIPTTTAFIGQEAVQIVSGNEAKCGDRSAQKFVLQKPHEEVREGHYNILNRTPVGESAFPVLCIYREEQDFVP